MAFCGRTVRFFLSVVLMAGLAQAETAIFWVSEPVQTGETVLVTGYFPQTAGLSIRVAGLSTSTADWQAVVSARGVEVRPVRSSVTNLMFVLPNLGDGVYGFRVDQPGQPALFGRINLPEPWWTLDEPAPVPLGQRSAATVNAAEGSTVLHIVGRCLHRDGQPTLVRLLSSDGHVAAALQPSGENRWWLSVPLPAGLNPGDYKIQIKNGSDGEGAWSSPFPIEMRPDSKRTLPVLKLSDFGAPAGGQDPEASSHLAAAVAKAQSMGGAIIFLAAGRYVLTEGLQLPPNVYLSGESAAQTALYTTDLDPAPDSWISGTHDFGVANLTLFVANHQNVISSDMSGDAARSGHVTLSNLVIRANQFRGHITPAVAGARAGELVKTAAIGANTVRLSGPDILILNCDVSGSGRSLYLRRANGAIVRGNKLHNGVLGWYNLDESQNVIVANNEISGGDLMSSGGSYSIYGPGSISRNIYTASNTYKNIPGWDREAFTSDGGGGAYLGKIAQANGADIQLPSPLNWGPRDWHNASVVILSGKGMGQWRMLEAWKSDHLTLGRPFAIAPDGTSTITIVPTHLHYIFYRNTFEDAGVAIQFYGVGIEHVVDQNHLVRAGGIALHAATYAGGIHPELYIQVLANQIDEGNTYRTGPANTIQDGQTTIQLESIAPSGAFGIIFRDNRLDPNSQLKIVGSSTATDAILLQGEPAATKSKSIVVDPRMSNAVQASSRVQ